MKQFLAHIAIVVDDYDQAIEFYTQKLHFALLEDTVLSDTKRWVLVRPKGVQGCALLLAKGVNAEQKSRIGNQTGGRVFLFLHTDDFERDYRNLLEHNIRIIRGPSVEPYGTVVVFEDLYGNLWDLIGPTKSSGYFCSTAVLKIKDPTQKDVALAALARLRDRTLLEIGVIAFDVLPVQTDPSRVILWESFVHEQDFQDHLNAEHVQAFMKSDLVELEQVYVSHQQA